MVLGRPPDPADVPPDTARLLRRGAEVHLLDERAISVRHEQSEVGIGLSRFSLRAVSYSQALPAVGSRQNRLGRWVIQATSICVRSSACTSASGEVPGTLRHGYAPRKALQSIRISRSETRPAGRC